MKNVLILLLKGFAVGLGKIIPGVSGALIAIILKIYEPILHAFLHLKENFWEHSKFLANLGIGIILAIILGSNMMLYVLNNYRLQAIFLFIGIILSGTITLFCEIKDSSINDKFVSGLIIIIIFLISFIDANNIFKSNNDIFNFTMYFISGVFDAIASIVPGISGTAILMSLGTYDTILLVLSSAYDVTKIMENILVILPFFLGIIIGTYFVSKFISYALKKYRIKSYMCIIGFSFVSVFILLKQTVTLEYTMSELLVGILLMIVGYIVSKKMNI